MKPIERRSLLKAMGGLAAGSYFSGLFQSAYAQSAPPLRLLVIQSEHGYPPAYWRPRMSDGSPLQETGWNLTFDPDSCMAPLEPHKDSLLLVEGLDLYCLYRQGASELTGHGGGWVAPLTGSDARALEDRRPTSPSIDVAMASLLQCQPMLYRQSGYNGANTGVCFDASGEPVPMLYDPRDLFTEWFSSIMLPTTDTAMAARKQAAELKVLASVKADAAKLRTRLPSAELPKLDAHLAGLALLEQQLMQPPPATCSKPGQPTYPQDPVLELQLVTDMVTRAFACNLTRVATLMITMGPYLPGVDLGGTDRQVHNDVAHSYRPDDDQSARYLARVQRWYADRMAELITMLKSVPEGNGTLYDSTIILWINELGDPAQHLSSDLPFVLAGGGGTFRRGRYLNFAGTQPHNGLLVSLANQFGANVNSFGEPDIIGELPGLV